MAYTIGVDTGGTFTDVVAIGGDGGTYTGKAATTPHDLIEGVLAAVAATAETIGVTTAETA